MNANFLNGLTGTSRAGASFLYGAPSMGAI